jgi:hypothetical protein
VSAPIRQLSLSQIPVFLLNSRLSLFSAAYFHRHPFSRSYGVILPSSLTRVLPFVSGFSPRPPASVYGTGTFGCTSSFSCQRELTRFPTSISVLSCLMLHEVRTSLHLTLDTFTQLTITALELSFCVTASFLGSAGISTCCPSPTTPVLGLGPDLPWEDEPSPGNLGLSTAVFLARLSLLIPAFSLLCSPHVLPVMLQPAHYAPLPLTIIRR